jgi:hypothetical protein
MGAKSAGQGGMPMPQGDVPAFDMPPMQPPPTMNTGPRPGMPIFSGDGSSRPFPGTNMPPMQPPMITNQGPGSGLAPKAPTQMDDNEYLRMLYQQELGRAPDEQGMNFWQQQLGGGMSRNDIQRMFDQSEEGMGYNQRRQPVTPGMPVMPVGYPGDAPTLPAAGGLGGGMPPEVADALRLAMSQNPRLQTGQGRMSAGLTTDAVAADRARRGLPIY